MVPSRVFEGPQPHVVDYHPCSRTSLSDSSDVLAQPAMMGVGPDIPTAATRTPLTRAQRGSARAARAWVKQWQASHGPPQYRAPVGWCASHCSAARCAGHCTRQQEIPLVLLQLSSTPARALLTHEKWMRTWWTLNPEHRCTSKPRPVWPASAGRPVD
eukprot:scaffold74658_cov69-Phaeocystis_antarctica.AAC.2